MKIKQETLSIVPQPKNIRRSAGKIKINPEISIKGTYVTAKATFRKLAEKFKKIKISGTEESGNIVFERNESLAENAYKIIVNHSGVIIQANEEESAINAACVLTQMMEKEEKSVLLPLCEISDYPDCSWRGVMVDLARSWHPVQMLYEYVDVCAYYRLNRLHLHFTDSESFTLPSRIFPKLSTPGRHYTKDELVALSRYAKSRGIQVVPELDIPGHCAAFVSAYGELFGKNGIIAYTERSLQGISDLIAEICETFEESDFIHVGGDEAEIAMWLKDEESAQRLKQLYGKECYGDKELTQRAYAEFIKFSCEQVLKNKKTPVVWEGFSEKYNGLIPKNSLIASWENYYQTTPQLLDAGFNLLNCSWKPLYVVTPKKYWSVEEIYDWNVRTFEATHPDSPFFEKKYVAENYSQIKGGELLAWGDHIVSLFPTGEAGVREEQKLMFERIPAFAENVWNEEKLTDKENFLSRYSNTFSAVKTFSRKQ